MSVPAAEHGERASASPWSRTHAATTVGVFSLAFLFAFEALGVATVMPAVAADLDGVALYPVAFAAPMAAAVVALVVAGPWCDRFGPDPVLVGGLAFFCVGVVAAGLAPTMEVFLLGRMLHGLGGGAIGVALYVVIAQAYPERLRPRVFAILTMAWVLPALVGPIVAATIEAHVGWRWVFLGVPVLAIGSWLLVRASRRTRAKGDGALDGRRIAAALLAAGGILLIGLAGQGNWPLWQVLVVIGLVGIVGPGRSLLPDGSWSGRPGLPAVLGTRALIGAAFGMAEVYLPLLLTLHRGLSLAQVGLFLSVGAVTWCLGAVVAARWSLLNDEVRRVRLGALLVGTGITGFALVAIPGVPLPVGFVAWGAGGLGIGMAFSTLSVLALGTAAKGEEGRTSSSLQLNDQLVMSAALALGSIGFAAVALSAPVAGATVLIVVAGLLGYAALAPARGLPRTT